MLKNWFPLRWDFDGGIHGSDGDRAFLMAIGSFILIV